MDVKMFRLIQFDRRKLTPQSVQKRLLALVSITKSVSLTPKEVSHLFT